MINLIISTIYLWCLNGSSRKPRFYPSLISPDATSPVEMPLGLPKSNTTGWQNGIGTYWNRMSTTLRVASGAGFSNAHHVFPPFPYDFADLTHLTRFFHKFWIKLPTLWSRSSDSTSKQEASETTVRQDRGRKRPPSNFDLWSRIINRCPPKNGGKVLKSWGKTPFVKGTWRVKVHVNATCKSWR
jgi:hypothetical protein